MMHSTCPVEVDMKVQVDNLRISLRLIQRDLAICSNCSNPCPYVDFITNSITIAINSALKTIKEKGDTEVCLTMTLKSP